MGRWFEGQCCARTRGRAAPGAEAYGTGQVMHSFMLRLSKRSGLCGSVVFSATRTSFVDALPVLFGGRGNKGACVCVCECVCAKAKETCRRRGDARRAKGDVPFAGEMWARRGHGGRTEERSCQGPQSGGGDAFWNTGGAGLNSVLSQPHEHTWRRDAAEGCGAGEGRWGSGSRTGSMERPARYQVRGGEL